MASRKHNDSQVTHSIINSEAVKPIPVNVNPSKMEPVNINNVNNENDRNSNLSPSKSADPARKKTFKIISVKKGGSGSGDLAGDNDGDSIDGLDESQTEDLSSEFYDSSKATDLDMDLQDNLMPLTPDEVTSSTTIVVKTKPDRDSQSRFKVVKIETKEPFRRGKWICYDFFDTAPASLVAVEKNGSKVMDESIINSALSGNLSSSSSVHFVHDVNDSSSNIYVSPFVPISPATSDGQQVFPDVFVPIQPAPASQVLNQFDGISSAEGVAPFIAQQVFMSMTGVPTSSTSFYSLAQPGHMAIIQSLPNTNVFPYNAQNGPLPTLYQNGISGPTTLPVSVPPDPLIVSGGGPIPAVIPPGMTSVPPVPVAEVPVVNPEQNQGFVMVGGVPVPRSQSQTHISGVPIVSQVMPPVMEGSHGLVNTATIPQQATTADILPPAAALEVEQMGPGMDESTGSIKTLQGDPEEHPPQGLEEAVETMYKGLEGVEDEVDESGGSTVAIDNKIEQAMDLVKRHLMYAVREEVEILKQQIGEMVERITQLEYENTVLKAEAKPETLNKLLQPRVTQAPSAAPLTAPVNVAPALQSQQQQQTVNTMQGGAPQLQTHIHIQAPASSASMAQQQPAQQTQLPPQASQQATHPPST